MKPLCAIFILYFFTLTAKAEANITLEYEFGIVLVDQYGQATGFEPTNIISLKADKQHIMYGLIVTSPNDQIFTLDSVHTIPSEQESYKILTKQIKVKNKAAIFMKAFQTDIEGDYQMEVFIDGRLDKTFNYQIKKNS